jgi:hypothetical protein
VDVLRSLARTMGDPASGGNIDLEGADESARKIAREEIASLAGLVLRRLQEPHPTRSFERNAADDIVRERMMSIFAEALADFSGRTGEGDEPGATS